MKCSDKDFLLNEIAKKHYISKSCVNLHLAKIRQILGVRNTLAILHTLYCKGDNSFLHINLTTQDTKVFDYILQGYKEREIGKLLGISLSAVKRHKERMIARNNCLTIKDLIRKFYVGKSSQDKENTQDHRTKEES